MGALKLGLYIHQRILKNGFTFNVVFVNALMDMYAKCERIQKASELFEKMHDADTISWNAMIIGYAQNRYVERASEFFDKLHDENTFS